jgi:hypothetical protein
MYSNGIFTKQKAKILSEQVASHIYKHVQTVCTTYVVLCISWDQSLKYSKHGLGRIAPAPVSTVCISQVAPFVSDF